MSEQSKYQGLRDLPGTISLVDRIWMPGERFVELLADMEDQVMSHFASENPNVAFGDMTVTLPVTFWMELIEEIKNRRPRNIPSFLQSHSISSQLAVIREGQALLDRLHEELSFVFVHSRNDIAPQDEERIELTDRVVCQAYADVSKTQKPVDEILRQRTRQPRQEIWKAIVKARQDGFTAPTESFRFANLTPAGWAVLGKDPD